MHGSGRPYGPFRERLDAFARDVEGIEAGDVEALHRARVASRRLRELLPLVGLEHDVARAFGRRLRKVTRQLGVVRELDVLLLLARELAEAGRSSVAALRPIGAAAAQELVSARERLSAKLPTAKLERLVRALERALNGLQSDDATPDRSHATGRRHAWRWALDARLVHRAAGLRDAIEAAGAVFVPQPLHRVRIAVKKLRYTLELAGEVTRKRTDDDLAALKGAQDLLGRLHDLGVLLDRAREAQALSSPPDLRASRDLSSLVHAVEDDCRRLHARYMRNRTELMAIANRMAAPRAQPLPRRAAV